MTDPDLRAEVEKIRVQWHAAEDGHEQAVRDRRPPIEITFLREKKERLKAAYLEKLKKLLDSNDDDGTS